MKRSVRDLFGAVRRAPTRRRDLRRSLDTAHRRRHGLRPRGAGEIVACGGWSGATACTPARARPTTTRGCSTAHRARPGCARCSCAATGRGAASGRAILSPASATRGGGLHRRSRSWRRCRACRCTARSASWRPVGDGRRPTASSSWARRCSARSRRSSRAVESTRSCRCSATAATSSSAHDEVAVLLRTTSSASGDPRRYDEEQLRSWRHRRSRPSAGGRSSRSRRRGTRRRSRRSRRPRGRGGRWPRGSRRACGTRFRCERCARGVERPWVGPTPLHAGRKQGRRCRSPRWRICAVPRVDHAVRTSRSRPRRPCPRAPRAGGCTARSPGPAAALHRRRHPRRRHLRARRGGRRRDRRRDLGRVRAGARDGGVHGRLLRRARLASTRTRAAPRSTSTARSAVASSASSSPSR